MLHIYTPLLVNQLFFVVVFSSLFFLILYKCSVFDYEYSILFSFFLLLLLPPPNIHSHYDFTFIHALIVSVQSHDELSFVHTAINACWLLWFSPCVLPTQLSCVLGVFARLFWLRCRFIAVLRPGNPVSLHHVNLPPTPRPVLTSTSASSDTKQAWEV